MLIQAPASDEYVTYYGTYVSKVTDPDVLEVLERQKKTTADLLAGLSPAQAAHSYAPGKWTIREIVGHLSDVERIFAYRMLRIARGDETSLAGFDENAYVPAGEFERRTLADLAAEFAAVRDATLSLVRSLSPEALARRGSANGAGVSARALVYIIAGHERHHMDVIRDRYL